MLHAPPTSFLIWSPKLLGEKYRSLSSSLCSFLNSHYINLRLTYSPQHPTLILCSSLIVSNQVSQPYKTTGKIMVLYNLNFG
jgi:hypothetical protein